MVLKVVVIFLSLGISIYAEAQTSYPVVDPATQNARDEDRRAILEAELEIERKKLTAAQALLAQGGTTERAADVNRHTENIKALQRELKGTGVPHGQSELQRVVIKAKRPDSSASPRSMANQANFWNPYNRTPEPDLSTVFSITSKGKIP